MPNTSTTIATPATSPAPLGPNGLTNVMRFIGAANIPRDIRQQRANNLSAMRRWGTPVIVKHMFNADDVAAGVAIDSENMDDIYNQPQHNDPISHGVGFVSVERSVNEWVSPTGDLVVSGTSPGTGYTLAPRYRGYGPGYLTYAIMPDVAQDVFKLSEIGALIKVQQAQVQMGWFPEVNDNDLLVIAEIGRNEQVIATHERYLLKQTNPVSMRGLDRLGKREGTEDFGNRFITDQSFEMTLIPENDELQNVEMDR